MPCLLLRGQGLVKTEQFESPRYLGDPINAVRIFNDKEIDELVLLDITATPQDAPIQFDVVQEIVSEAFVPVTYGGGVRTVDDVGRLLALGVEKVAINSAAVERPALIEEMADEHASSTIVVAIDAKRRRRRYEITTRSGATSHRIDPAEWARQAAQLGAGEIFLNSVDRDGTMTGYDLDLIRAVSDAVSVPVVACGGARDVDDLCRAVLEGGASASAAGALFVFQGRHRAVLINFPSQDDLDHAFGVPT